MSTHSPELILDDDREDVAGPNEEEPIRSTSDHVLVIDDEPDMLGLYKACLSSHGYRVTAASDGPAGLDLAVVDPPTLVILDMIMPGMGGIDVLERLRGDSRTQSIPVLMVSGQDDVDARVKCIKKGVDDFIAKPFEYEELVARVEALIRRLAQHGNARALPLGPDDRRRLQILHNAIREGSESLVPDYDIRTASGYAYPAAGESSEEDGPRDPIEDLEHLHSRGYLERTFHDVVLTCPYCEHHNIHLREVCPACGSADLRPVVMIHHYRCAFVGPSDSFQKGNKLVCPKCRVQLRHIGLEYEKPTDTVQCGSCDRGFQEPDVAARCRGCRRPFPPEQAERRRIFAYAITASGRFAADVGSLIESPGGPDFTEEDTEVYRPEFFRELVGHEVARGISLGHPTALLRIGVRGLDKLIEARGPVAGRRVLHDVVRNIRGVVRGVDKIGRIRSADFVVLIPGADTRAAVAMARRLAETFTQIEDENFEKVGLSYAWAIHPHEAEDAHSLLARVMEETPTPHLGDPNAYEPRFEASTMLPAYGTPEEEMDDTFQYVDADAVDDVPEGEEAFDDVEEGEEDRVLDEEYDHLVEPSTDEEEAPPDEETEPYYEGEEGEEFPGEGTEVVEYDDDYGPAGSGGDWWSSPAGDGEFARAEEGDFEFEGPYELADPAVVPDARLIEPVQADGSRMDDPDAWWSNSLEEGAGQADGYTDVEGPAGSPCPLPGYEDETPGTDPPRPPAAEGEETWWSAPSSEASSDEEWMADGASHEGAAGSHPAAGSPGREPLESDPGARPPVDEVEAWWSSPPATGGSGEEYRDDQPAASPIPYERPGPASAPVDNDEAWWSPPAGDGGGERDPGYGDEHFDSPLDTELVLPEDEDFHSAESTPERRRQHPSAPVDPVPPPLDDEDAWWGSTRDDEDDGSSSDSGVSERRGKG